MLHCEASEAFRRTFASSRTFTLVSRQKDTHKALFLVKEVRHMPLPMLPKVIPSRQQSW